MLGKRLRNERNNVCKFGCCTRTKAHRVRKTKQERNREKKTWKRGVDHGDLQA